ncbi:MAG: hypothetical protein PGN27_19620 [Mycolicibacterium neoaurum]|uniref:hypothetical protein n=1 Tax=Mycolicibacterium neoaurum TaxID=1795 RepID=UPI002FFBD063
MTLAPATSAIAAAEPVDPGAAAPSAPIEPAVSDAARPEAVSTDPTADPTSMACQQFTSALNYATTNYEDFAYATAGTGDHVDYSKPDVVDSNTTGRTALREAAATALTAGRTPGLAPDISDPMQAWSLHATKLLLDMGLHRGGDALNTAASQMNTDAQNAQLACARIVAQP